MRTLRLTLFACAALLATACGDDGSTTTDSGTGTDTGTGMDTTTGTDSGGTDSGTATGCEGETTIALNSAVTGTTGAGWDEDLTDWFNNSDVACDPFGTDYPAPFQVYSLPLPENSTYYPVVTPTAGVDVSVVSWIQSAVDTSCYPTRGIGVVSCEVANAGAADAIENTRHQATTNPYHLVVLVTTPPGGTAGDFSLEVVDVEPAS